MARPTRDPAPEQVAAESSRRLVYLAAERTLTSWIRTALSLMALGFVIDRFDLILRHFTGRRVDTAPYSHLLSVWGGSIMIGMGIAMAVASGLHYLRFALRYRRDGSTELGHSLTVGAVFALLFGAFGVGLLSVLIVLVE